MNRLVERAPRNRPASIFGANVARERQRQCKSMETLARLGGTHTSEISRLERGLRDPRLSTVVRVARGLDVPATDLLDGIG